MPTKKEEHVEERVPAQHGREISVLVKQDIDARIAQGIATYGEPLRAFNGRNATKDLYEELLDAAMYVRQVLEERDILAAETHLRDQVSIEVLQHDWIPGFAAFVHAKNGLHINPEARAHVVLNLGGLLGIVATGAVPPTELPYYVAECLMHEVVHVLEAWAGVEFNEERVEQLIGKYRASIDG